MILESLFFLQLAFGDSSPPQCIRPPSLSKGQMLINYEKCLDRQTAFCQKHAKDKACVAMQIQRRQRPSVFGQPKASDCYFKSDGGYRCPSAPMRFVEEPQVKAGNPVPDPTHDDAHADPTPSPDPGGSLAIPPPPPAKPLPAPSPTANN